MNIFEKMFGSESEPPKEEADKNACPVCHTPLAPVGPQKEGSSFNAYKCPNGHEVLQ